MKAAGFGAAAILVAAVAACGSAGETPAVQETPAMAECAPTEMLLEGRASPYDSAMVTLGGAEAKICYGRPSARGRTIFGGLVPYGELWRTGANEPTILHLPVAAEIAGIAAEPGSYSLYTVPGETEWTVIVNRSTSQWGEESGYTEEVRAREVGRATVPSEQTDTPVEQFTIRAEPAGEETANLVLEWVDTRVLIPIERTAP